MENDNEILTLRDCTQCTKTLSFVRRPQSSGGLFAKSSWDLNMRDVVFGRTEYSLRNYVRSRSHQYVRPLSRVAGTIETVNEFGDIEIIERNPSLVSAWLHS